MVIVETRVFTRRVLELLQDEQYRAFQSSLLYRPESGDLIPGGGGLRKARVAAKQSGKSGGARVIYYYNEKHETIYMLLIYAKNEQENLTAEELKILRKLVKENLV